MLSLRNKLLLPLPAAVCRLLYTFCKIRGEKVVVRLLSSKTKYLELVLVAVERAERLEILSCFQNAGHHDSSVAITWTWEERYISLLWLSHLLLAPFDLSNISSVDMEDLEPGRIDHVIWPERLPGLVVRVVNLAIKYLSSPGKERDGASAVLVRLALRRDMQEIGLLRSLVRWALESVQPRKDGRVDSPYHYIGVLSFLAGVLRSSVDTSDMDAYLESIFHAIDVIASGSDDPVHKVISASALARKTIIKVVRSVAVIFLRHKQVGTAPRTAVVEDTIGHLLVNLRDNDTSVRFAASKALSIITLKLDLEMASEVVDAVLDSLNKNALWKHDPADPTRPLHRDISNVDPHEWHGLVLTLSHLLYRRSPPPEKLFDIVSALLKGLEFDHRRTGGGSFGANVRDASCFGIWALARRYTTDEMFAVDDVPRAGAIHQSNDRTESQEGDRQPHGNPRRVLQLLATNLVVTACLDPAGNIRRGASAALQELIGRHPEKIRQGIAIVQAVDYHSVALRSRATQEVSLSAADLDGSYGIGLSDGILGWRGIGDLDAGARRGAGMTFGRLTRRLIMAFPIDEAPRRMADSINVILDRIKRLQLREVEERHGLLLCLASILDNMIPELPVRMFLAGDPGLVSLVRWLVPEMSGIVQLAYATKSRRPALVAEAASHLIVSCLALLQADILTQCHKVGKDAIDLGNPGTGSTPTGEIFSFGYIRSGTAQLARCNLESFATSLGTLDTLFRNQTSRQRLHAVIEVFKTGVGEWLGRPEPEVTEQASAAALVVLAFSSPDDREFLITRWAEAIRFRPTSSQLGSGVGHFVSLATVRRVFPASDKMLLSDSEASTKASDALLTRWFSDKGIETRVTILKSLVSSGVLATEPLTFVHVLEEGLDDYTTTNHGDVGSAVRLESLRATKSLWSSIGQCLQKEGKPACPHELSQLVKRLYLRVLRLAAEKLDRVRVEAQRVLALSLREK